jgi:hypothetical protein
LEGKLEWYDEGVVNERKNRALGKDVGDFAWTLSDVGWNRSVMVE